MNLITNLTFRSQKQISLRESIEKFAPVIKFVEFTRVLFTPNRKWKV